eukprot:765449-Hanusia_phi.AAC.2
MCEQTCLLVVSQRNSHSLQTAQAENFEPLRLVCLILSSDNQISFKSELGYVMPMAVASSRLSGEDEILVSMVIYKQSLSISNVSDSMPVACKFHRLPEQIDVVNKRCLVEGNFPPPNNLPHRSRLQVASAVQASARRVPG